MHGLKNTLLEKVIRPYWNYRGDEKNPGKPTTFHNFLKKRPDGGEVIMNRAGKPADLLDLLTLEGIDPYHMTIGNAIGREDDFKWLIGPFIEDAVWQGYISSDDKRPALWTVLCFAIGVPAQQESIMRVKLGFKGAPAPTGELENLPTTTLSHSDESLSWKKTAWMLQMSNELVRFAPLPVIEPWFAEAGRIQQHSKNLAVVKAIVNGTVPTGNDACPIIGVLDTEKGLQYIDHLDPWGVGDEIGEQWFTMLHNRSMSVTIGSIEEFKRRESGTPKVALKNSPEPDEMDRYVSPEVPDDQEILVDTSHCVRERVSIPFHIKQAEKLENYSQAVAFIESYCFEKIGEKSCIGIDQTLDRETHPIPAWFELGESRP
jgi:hypothetical protein